MNAFQAYFFYSESSSIIFSYLNLQWYWVISSISKLSAWKLFLFHKKQEDCCFFFTFMLFVLFLMRKLSVNLSNSCLLLILFLFFKCVIQQLELIRWKYTWACYQNGLICIQILIYRILSSYVPYSVLHVSYNHLSFAFKWQFQDAIDINQIEGIRVKHSQNVFIF